MAAAATRGPCVRAATMSRRRWVGGSLRQSVYASQPAATGFVGRGRFIRTFSQTEERAEQGGNFLLIAKFW
jgi:hypothetical protein